MHAITLPPPLVLHAAILQIAPNAYRGIILASKSTNAFHVNNIV